MQWLCNGTEIGENDQNPAFATSFRRHFIRSVFHLASPLRGGAIGRVAPRRALCAPGAGGAGPPFFLVILAAASDLACNGCNGWNGRKMDVTDVTDVVTDQIIVTVGLGPRGTRPARYARWLAGMT